jgi:hypothetical protein
VICCSYLSHLSTSQSIAHIRFHGCRLVASRFGNHKKRRHILYRTCKERSPSAPWISFQRTTAISDIETQSRDVRYVPKADIPRRTKMARYSITSSVDDLRW